MSKRKRSKKQKEVKQRNLITKDLMTPLYHQRIEKNKKGKTSWKREKKVTHADWL